MTTAAAVGAAGARQRAAFALLGTVQATLTFTLTAIVVQGAGAALVAPAAMAAVRAVSVSPAAYGKAMATWGGLSVLGATAGNLLSGVISTLLSWRWTFAVPLGVAVTAPAWTRGSRTRTDCCRAWCCCRPGPRPPSPEPPCSPVKAWAGRRPG